MATATAESLERCLAVLASGIEDRLRKIDQAVIAIAVQMREVEERRTAIRTLLEEIRGE